MRHVFLNAALLLAMLVSTAGAETFRSHPPVRRLPVASQRPLATGPAKFVDAVRGDDRNDGSKSRPWKSLAHAVTQLRPGDTLYLRGGTHYGATTVSLAGTKDKPITIRSFPGELAIIDGGFPEFATDFAEQWEPVAGGAPDEFRSKKTYPNLAKEGRRGVKVIGNFADSMVPLHGYRFEIDFHSTNPYWTVGYKLNDKTGVYLGPGVWFDAKTARIHVRLSHLKLKSFGKDVYRGESDPRKLPLVIAGPVTPLRLEKCRHLRLQDLVIRGSASQTLAIADSSDLQLDGLSIYGGTPAVHVRATQRMRLTNSVIRGLSSPWSSRSSHKYRGNSPYLFIVDGRGMQCSDFEIAHCEFTDNHDGLIVGTVRNLKFHHNLVENFDDDGIYLTTGRSHVPANIRIYQNRLNQAHTMFSFTGAKTNPVGPGVYIYRNIIDFRRRTLNRPPDSAEKDAVTQKADWSRPGRPCSDHGSPTWEPMFVYHNTVIFEGRAFRGYYGAGFGGHTARTQRRVFNNIFLHVDGLPGLNFSGPNDDAIADGNLHWSISDGPKLNSDFFAKFRRSKVHAALKERYAPGPTAHDQFADPKFVRFTTDPSKPWDLRLQPGSPAVNAGVPIPKDWPDPLRKPDAGKPDLGAIPLGVKTWTVGPVRDETFSPAGKRLPR